MTKYYFSFGVRYDTEDHPTLVIDGDTLVEIEARDSEHARELMVSAAGTAWGFQYQAWELNKLRKHFGRIVKLDEVTRKDEAMDDQETTWDNGPWIVEVKRTYIVSGCGVDKGRRAVMATIDNTDMPDDEQMPDVKLLNHTSQIYPSSSEPFDPDEFRDDAA